MKFSIITINYNNRDGLQRTIDSVINQTYRDFEFIVIDGNSTDGSVELIKKYSDRIDYWVSESDKGIYDAMNKGIKQSKGQFLNFMNSGDCFYSNDVLEIISQHPLECDILVGRDYHYNEKTGQGFASILPQRLSMITFYTSTLPHQSAFLKKELFNNTLYDTNLKICSDWMFYLHKIVNENCSVCLIDEIICCREPGGISNVQIDKISAERKQVLCNMIPSGIRKDYDTLTRLDRSTLYKFLSLCDNKKTVRYLTFCIKILYRLFIK